MKSVLQPTGYTGMQNHIPSGNETINVEIIMNDNNKMKNNDIKSKK